MIIQPLDWLLIEVIMEQLRTILLDDGTLDTIIQVTGSKGTKVFRYTTDDSTPHNRVELAMVMAEEDYFMEE